MGLELYAYAASYDEWASLYSSRDDAFWRRLLRSRSTAVRSYLGIKGPLPKTTSTSVPRNLEPLYEILTGGSCRNEEPHRYAYAMIACLACMGAPIGTSGGSYGRFASASVMVHDLGERASILPDLDMDWPLPGVSTPDGPYNWVERRADVAPRARELRALVERLTKPLSDPSNERVKNTLHDYVRLYEAAVSAGADLIVVCH